MLHTLEQYRPNWLDLPISIFSRAVARTDEELYPEGTTTLRRIVSSRHYRLPVEAIRSELDEDAQKELKKQLRAYTPIALLNHRRKETSFTEKIACQWPLLAADVDAKDNPDVDMDELKTHLCRLSYVLLCARSVRSGLWFVIRLPDNQTPEILATHFRYIQRLFSERFGVKLDSSKGGNPTHLRYVSYDPEPYYNEDATVMHKTYTPPPIPRQNYYTTSTFRPTVEEGTLVARIVQPVAEAVEGQRHPTLLKQALLAGGYVAGGQLKEETIVGALETIVRQWPMFTKSRLFGTAFARDLRSLLIPKSERYR